MENLDKKLQEVIKDSLPQKIGEELKKELEELAYLRVATEQQAAEIKSLTEARDDLQRKLSQHDSLNSRQNKLDNRESAISERERNQEISDLKIQLEEANKRAEIVRDFTSGLVRNTQFRKDIYSSRNWDEVHKDNTGYPINMSLTDNQSGSETTIEE